MTPSAYQLWIATINHAVQSGLTMSEALALADTAAQSIKGE